MYALACLYLPCHVHASAMPMHFQKVVQPVRLITPKAMCMLLIELYSCCVKWRPAMSSVSGSSIEVAGLCHLPGVDKRALGVLETSRSF